MEKLKKYYWQILELPDLMANRLRLFLEPSGAGDWIFETSVLKWTFDPKLRSQLPWTHRFFSRYAAIFRISNGRKVILGDRVFRIVTRLHQLLAMPTEFGLRIGDYTIFLNPRDPRMLQVPNELTDPSLDALKLKQFLKEGDSFLDVGANHGSFSLVAAGLVGPTGTVTAIEPQPLLSKLVRQSLEKTAKCPYVVHQFACSDHEGQAEFFVPSGSSGSAGLISAFSASGNHQSFKVEVKRFDDTVAWRDLPGTLFVKLDIEGSELAFLKGASEMVSTRRPKIMMEINPTSMAGAGVELTELVSFFRGRGYTHYIELDNLDRRLPISEIRSSPRNVVLCADG